MAEPTIKQLCEKILRERNVNGNAEYPVKHKRTVRSAVLNNDAQPIIIKSLLDVQHKDGSKHTETSLDQIIQQLQRGKWPPDVVVLITPASKHNNLYKLHVIDRNSEDHLGMTSITQKELGELKASNVFEKYATIVGNKYIDLKTVTLNTAIIANIMKNLNRNCCRAPYLHPEEKTTTEFYASESSSESYTPQPQQQHSNQEQHNICHYQTESGMGLVTLIDRINDAVQPSDHDLTQFFNLAERYKFKIFIRPELCWKSKATMPSTPTIPLTPSDKDELVRFNIECFMLFDKYVGTITMNSELLHEQLHKHPDVLSRVQVIEDVCEITPLPKYLRVPLRKLSEWLGLEIFYDSFGEFLYDLYKKCA